MGWERRFGRFLWRWITVLIPVAVIVLTAASGATDSHYKIASHRLATSWTLIVIAALLALLEVILVGRRQRRVEKIDRERRQFAGRVESAERALMRLSRRVDRSTGASRSLQRRARQSLSLRRRLLHSGRPAIGDADVRPEPGRVLPARPRSSRSAWRQNTAGVKSLPSPGDDPTPRRRWLDAQKKLNVPEEVASAFVMRSHPTPASASRSATGRSA